MNCRVIVRQHNVPVPAGPRRCSYSRAYSDSEHRWYPPADKYVFPHWLFDEDGCVVFESKKDLESCPDITSTPGAVHAYQGLKRIRGYRRF